MALSDKHIKQAQKEGAIRIDPFEEKQVRPAPYNLRDVTKSLQSLSQNVAVLSKQQKMTMWAVGGGFGLLTVVIAIVNTLG